MSNFRLHGEPSWKDFVAGESVGLLSTLFGTRKVLRVDDPEVLREHLLDATSTADDRRLADLCRTNQDLIFSQFPLWQKVPDAVRNDPAQTKRYVESLIAVAHFFAERLHRQELLQLLVGTPASNPLLRWQESLQRARTLMQDLNYREAGDLLNNLLIDSRDLKGSGTDTYLPVTYGLLGECYFQGNTSAKAVVPTQRALELCEQHSDHAGVIAYLGNLYEIHRYLGENEAAAGLADRLANALAAQGKAENADRYKKQARVVRAGEPRNRVVAIVDGRRFEIQEAPQIKQGRVQFQFERNRISLQPSVAWTARGEEHGRAGRHDEALGAFRKAACVDPYDPHPHYLSGLSLLHLQRASEAVGEYRTTEELAPGWFHCRSDLWLAEQLALGHLEHGVFLTLQVLEDGNPSQAEKIKLTDAALAAHPELALLHLFRGKNLGLIGKTADAEAAFRRGLSLAPEPDARTRLLVELAAILNPGEERRRLLDEAVEQNGHLVAAATACLMLRH